MLLVLFPYLYIIDFSSYFHILGYISIYSNDYTLLYIVGPAVLLALLFFNLTFIALGNSYIPTEELLDKEEKNQRCGGAEKEKPLLRLSEERRNFIQNSLDQWCMDLGYKDCNVNMLTLSRTLCISKNELSLFFDQCLHSNFRIWLSEIRLNAAKKMMLEYPDYSNDIISAECGFSCRTHLYRIFKTKEGCSPTEWRDFQSTYAAQNDSNGAESFFRKIPKKKQDFYRKTAKKVSHSYECDTFLV